MRLIKGLIKNNLNKIYKKEIKKTQGVGVRFVVESAVRLAEDRFWADDEVLMEGHVQRKRPGAMIKTILLLTWCLCVVEYCHAERGHFQ